MIMNSPIRRRPKPSEDGYMLIAVIFMLAILVISLSVAVPKISKQIQRDREVETMRRGKQYVRAVKMYYKKFGAYPPSIDALVKTNEIRFLRKKYIDPTTGKDEWKIIRFGQNKTQSMGFFGQPIGGSTIAGTGPGSTGPNPSQGMFNTSQNGSQNPPNQNTSGTPGSPADPNNPNNPTDPNAPGGNLSTGTGTGLNGQTFGGGGIIGVTPGGTKQSILVYKKKTHYNEWEFFYDPLVDQMMMQGGNTGTIGQPISNTTTPVGGPPSPSGTPPGPTPAPPPAPPQQ
jgi:type II secretory pathway pseudopilin PulG